LLPWIVGLYFIIQGLLFFVDYFETKKAITVRADKRSKN
jgi:uncharacterized membrane protein HdeD (DUF308 family)